MAFVEQGGVAVTTSLLGWRNDPRTDEPTLDLGFARLDVDRARRTGDPEVVYGAGKTPAQVVDPAHAARGPPRPGGPRDPADRGGGRRWRVAPRGRHRRGRSGGHARPDPGPARTVTVVSAGTSDAPVAAEAALTARVFGAGVELINDVGVAGLHRVLGVRDQLDDADCLIVVAGMEGALPSVVGGLTGVPLVAVPTSVGYGASFGGLAALLAMLNSCAPGVSVVNIDNGFGAGVFAARVARNARRADRDDRDRLDRRILRRQRRHAARRAGRRRRRSRCSQDAVDAVAPEPVTLSVEDGHAAAASRRPACHVEVADSATTAPGATSAPADRGSRSPRT